MEDYGRVTKHKTSHETSSSLSRDVISTVYLGRRVVVLLGYRDI